MALKIATKAMQLTLARDGEEFIPIETMFDDNQQQALIKLNEKLKGTTQKQSNPLRGGLAWEVGKGIKVKDLQVQLQ
ncbi:MAG: hypothetical protein IPH31_10920 [Lewinellaceae bacterium]|nr:hypothetical protein [Lewinellaceae bacterium]